MMDDEDFVNQHGIVYGRHVSEKRGQAIHMRHQMTSAESILWNHLRADRLHGLHFRRQQIIDGLIADFYCHAAGLVVECDGPVHDKQEEHDTDRDAILTRRGLLVLRFRNEQIESDVESVLAHILSVAQERKNAIRKTQ